MQLISSFIGVAVGLSMSSDKATAQYAVAAPATMTRQPVIGPGAVQYNKPVAARAQHVVSRATKPRCGMPFARVLVHAQHLWHHLGSI